jgi:hypothetical protein
MEEGISGKTLLSSENSNNHMKRIKGSSLKKKKEEKNVRLIHSEVVVRDLICLRVAR